MKKIIILAIFTLFISNNINAQSYYKKDGKFGALSKDGAILTEAKYDTVYMPRFAYRAEYLITKYSDKYGIIIFSTDTTPIIIQPKFDFIYYQDICDIVILKQGNKYGFIDYKVKYEAGSPALLYWIKNVYISDIKYDSIIGHYLYDGNRVGFLFKGYMTFGDRLVIRTYSVIPAIYDTITSYIGSNKFENLTEGNISIKSINYSIIKVVKAGFVNYLTVSYKDDTAFRPLFPNNAYTPNEITYFEESKNFLINQIGKPLIVYHPKDSTYSVITDYAKNPIVLNKYYSFIDSDYLNDNNVLTYVGVNNDVSEMITIFIDKDNNQNSIVYKDTIFDKAILDKRIRYEKMTIQIKNPNAKSALNVESSNDWLAFDSPFIPKTVFIAKYSRCKTESGYKTEVTLISYPNNKEFYTTILNDDNEQLLFDRIDYPQDDCNCPYFKLVKEIKTSKNQTKLKALGYINFKTYVFSTKTPRDKGCKELQYRM